MESAVYKAIKAALTTDDLNEFMKLTDVQFPTKESELSVLTHVAAMLFDEHPHAYRCARHHYYHRHYETERIFCERWDRLCWAEMPAEKQRSTLELCSVLLSIEKSPISPELTSPEPIDQNAMFGIIPEIALRCLLVACTTGNRECISLVLGRRLADVVPGFLTYFADDPDLPSKTMRESLSFVMNDARVLDRLARQPDRGDKKPMYDYLYTTIIVPRLCEYGEIVQKQRALLDFGPTQMKVHLKAHILASFGRIEEVNRERRCDYSYIIWNRKIDRIAEVYADAAVKMEYEDDDSASVKNLRTRIETVIYLQ